MTRTTRTVLTRLALWTSVAAGIAAATQLHGPYLARVRGSGLVVLVAAGLVLLGAGLRWRKDSLRGWLGLITAGICLVVVPTGLERLSRLERQAVLAAPTASLERYGRHFVLGYRSFDELAEILWHTELGGIYLTARNVRGRPVEQIRAEIDALQAIQRARGRPPLLVMADQEGGLVSRLSPPLPERPNLGQVLDACGEGPWQAAVIEFASQQAEEIAALGVNCNLSPVVDLKLDGHRGLDLHTKLSERATSADPRRTAAAAQLYALTLRQHGVLATAKHFPGLGHVAEDTHHFQGWLRRPLKALLAEDWVPFAALARSDAAAIMVGHVRVAEVDPDRLASTSGALIDGILRGRLGHRGLVLTDDLCMAPTFYAEGGIGESARRALSAGADLVLVTYDPDMFFPAMASLLRSAPADLPRRALARSQVRLAATRRRLGLAAGGPAMVAGGR